MSIISIAVMTIFKARDSAPAQAEPAVREFRLALTRATLTTLTNALTLLGIGVPEKM